MVARPFVKWSEEVRRLADLPRAIHRAAKTALAPPTGPVFLSLPGDILTDSADLDLGQPTRVATGLRGDASAIAAAAALMAKARSPGDHRRRRGAAERCAAGAGGVRRGPRRTGL